MSDPVGVGGGWFPPGHERAKLVADLGRYLALWELRLRDPAASGSDLGALRQRSVDLQAQARAVGFGGVAHHLSRLTTLIHAGGPLDVASLRAALKDLSELAWQAKQELPPADGALIDRALEEPLPAAAGGAPPSSLVPPPMLTVHPALRRGVVSPAPFPEPPAAPEPPRIVSPLPPSAPAVKPDRAPAPEAPPPSERARPNLAVRTMFRLRSFGHPVAPPPPSNEAPRGPSGAPPPPAPSPILGLRGFSNPPPAPPAAPGIGAFGAPGAPISPGAPGLPGIGVQRPPESPDAAHPRFLSNSLPPLPNAGEARAPSTGDRGMAELLGRVSPRRESSGRGRRDSQGAKGLRRREIPGSVFPWWLGVLAALGAGVLVLVAVLSWNRLRQSPDTPRGATSAASSATPSTSALAGSASATAGAAAKGRTPADDALEDIRVKAHGRGAKESPELKAWVDHQAALQAKLLETGKCEGSAAACAILYRAGEDAAASRGRIVPKKTSSPSSTVRSRWLAGLRMPSIPVADDVRVQRIFERYTDTATGREQFQQMLFRCGAYRDHIQATLIRYDLPPSLLAVVFAESACNPTIRSPVGAEGLWQFMPEAGRAYHLHITEDVLDERHSPVKATEAAIHFLADLYAKFGSWDLAFAAYNMGPYGLHARMHRAGGEVGFWDLLDADLLPSETSNYVPIIEAFALILENLQKLKFAGTQMRAPEVTGDLDAPPGTRLGLVARAAATSVNQIRSLNLDLKADVIPTIPGQRFIIQVPHDTVWQARDALDDLRTQGSYEDQCVPDTFDWGKQRFTPEMKDECRRKLGAGAARSSPTP
ncbi:MAG TPA: lytic transglycosylase domain-containing protein [Polyangiaceae bacterium]|nr:lytic transglycosylase domain-containing protein [Polyangiaceae bacterium]